MCKTTEHPITNREHKNSIVYTELIHHRLGGHVLMATALPKRPEFEKPPVLICNGYGSGIGAMGRLATILAEEEGRSVITYNEQRSRAAWSDPLGFRSETILSVMDRFDKNTKDYFTQPTLIGWSTGGPAAIGVAERLLMNGEEKRIGAVIPTASAGIGPQAGEVELTIRAGLEVARGLRSVRMVRALGLKAAQCSAGYLCGDVVLSLREVNALSELDVSRRLIDLEQAGLPLSIIAMKHDLIFPVDRMAAAIEQTGLSQKLRVIDGTHINLAWQRSTIGRVVDVIDETEAAGTAETAA